MPVRVRIDGRRRDRARRTALLYFERRRSQVASELTRLKRPRKRYADLRLAAALGRTESACCRTAQGQTEFPTAADDCLMASLELQVMRAERGLARMERWLSQGARARAEAEAEDRFRAISAEVESELTSDGLLDPPTADAAPAPPGVDAARCAATTRKGTRCRNAAKTNALCPIHARVHAEIAAEELREAATRALATADGERHAKVGLVVLRERLPSVSLAALRRRLPRPDLAAWRQRLPKFGIATPVVRLPKFRIATPHVRLPRLDVTRLGAGTGWALGGSAALAVAFALIWSGLADSGEGTPGQDLTVALGAAPQAPLGAPGADLHRDAVLASVERRDTEAGDRVDANASAASRSDSGSSAGASAQSSEAVPSAAAQPAAVPVATPAPAPAPGSAPAPTPAPTPDGGGSTGTGDPEPEPGPSPSGPVGETVAGVTHTVSQLVGTLQTP
jgi:hypothetical protein